MPELPEVETVRRGLSEVLPGHVAAKVRVTGRRTARRQGAAELRRRLEGRGFEKIDRRGKYLAASLDDGQVLVMHLRMSGQLLFVPDPEKVPAPKHTHVVVELEDGSELRFVDPRTFGEWFVTDDLQESGLPSELARLGPDPVAERFGAKVLAERLSSKRTALKVALTDQRVIAGIGNLYADEICHLAGVRPDKRCDELDGDELKALARAISRVLRAAIEKRGSSLRDAQYRDLMGELGGYQAHHRVYDRAGEACDRCGTLVEKVQIGARSAYLCPGCQAP